MSEMFPVYTGLDHQDFIELLDRTKEKIMAPRDIHFQLQQPPLKQKKNYTNRLSPANRLLACLMVLRQCKISTLQVNFGYSRSACTNDFRVLMAIFISEGDSIKIPDDWNPPHPLLNTVGSVDHSHFRIGRIRYDQMTLDKDKTNWSFDAPLYPTDMWIMLPRLSTVT